MNVATWPERLFAATGLLFLALFGSGVLLADLLADRSFPPPSASLDEIAAYFAQNGGPVRGLSLCHAFAAFALLLFAGFLAHRVQDPRHAAVNALGMIAAVAGGAAGVFLMLDAALFWVLSLPEVSRDPALLRALHALSYLCGGVALALPLAALIGATSLQALRVRLLPRWLAWVGLLAGLDCLVYGTSLISMRGIWSPSGLVLAAVLPLVWIFATSLTLILNPHGDCAPDA